MTRLTAALVVLVLAALAGCGSSSDDGTQKTATKAATPRPDPATQKLAAPGEATSQQAAPGFTLKNSLGDDVSLASFKGKAVYLMFIYDHCPDVCPLMVSTFHTALSKMSAADKAKQQIIAVSVDPRGDTPKTVNQFLSTRLMTGKMQYLIGSKKQLTPVWKQWDIKVETSPERREEVGHSAFVYGITGSGKVRALYPSNFKAAWIVHDTPILAAG